MEIHVVPYEADHRDELLRLAIRAWAPVFPVLKSEVPRFVYDAFYPQGWRGRQLTDLAEVLDGEPDAVDVAIDDDGRPVGWVCTRIHPGDRMGEVYVLAVDPDCQRRGVGRALMDSSVDRVRDAGMVMLMVETGDDSGHAPARASYEAAGFERWPVARYFKKLDYVRGF